MDWIEFKSKLGELQTPTLENGIISKFIESENSRHIMIWSKDIEVEKFQQNSFEVILSAINILESRGAKREVDYIVTAMPLYIHGLQIGVHTTNNWLSQEDFIEL